MQVNAPLVAAFLVSCIVGFSQSTYGVFKGAIADPSGAVVRDAVVEAANANTGVLRSVKTNAEGFFRIPNLDPGTYNLTVNAPGFARAEQKKVDLPAREEVQVDLQLQLATGNLTTVEVNGTSEVSDQLTMSHADSGKVIDSLALNFRATSNPSPINVATVVAPGVNIDSGGNLTFAGQLPTATSFSLDGISTQLPRFGGPTKDLFPSVEGIAEFKVNTAANSAEYSQPTDLTVITRSGTNDFHGTAFWYLQRKDFNSQDQIAHVIPTGDADSFGVSVGGPVQIPGVYEGKNRTFFYFDYEGVRLSSNTLINTFTPPAQWRTGDFSGAGATIVDPTIGQPFANNIVPQNRINSVSAKALPLFFPNPTSSAAALSSPNFVTTYPETYNVDGFDSRLDHVFSPNHHVWGRITQKNITNVGTDANAFGAGGAAGDGSYNPTMGPFSSPSELWNFAGSYNWIIRSNLINEFRLAARG